MQVTRRNAVGGSNAVEAGFARVLFQAAEDVAYLINLKRSFFAADQFFDQEGFDQVYPLGNILCFKQLGV